MRKSRWNRRLRWARWYNQTLSRCTETHTHPIGDVSYAAQPQAICRWNTRKSNQISDSNIAGNIEQARKRARHFVRFEWQSMMSCLTMRAKIEMGKKKCSRQWHQHQQTASGMNPTYGLSRANFLSHARRSCWLKMSQPYYFAFTFFAEYLCMGECGLGDGAGVECHLEIQYYIDKWSKNWFGLSAAVGASHCLARRKHPIALSVCVEFFNETKRSSSIRTFLVVRSLGL